MLENWNTYKLEDAVEKIIDYRGKTPQKSTSGIPLITAKVIKDGRIQTPEEFIADDLYEVWMTRGFPQYNDVVLTTEAPLGEVAQIKTHAKIALAQRVITLRGKQNVIDSTFLKYFFQSPVGQNNLKSKESGSTVTGIKQSELRQVEIYAPDFNQQRRIAEILSALDEKIELNLEMNRTLERIAQATFKHWFVDFQFPGFDGELVDGLPKGWNKVPLEDLVDTISATHKFPNDKIIFLNTSDVLEGEVLCHQYSDVKTLPGQAKKSISKNDILFSEIRPANKRYAFIDFDADDYVVSTKLMVLRAKGEVDPMVLYYFLKSDDVLQELQMLAESRSGTFPQITFYHIKNLEMIVPTKDILDTYTNLLKSNYEKISANNKQNKTLTQIRDSLLPKLMSGKIRVGE